MGEYFQHIVSKLTLDDMKILGILSDQDANALFKSIKKKAIQEMTNISVASFRKSMDRLEASGLIELDTRSKEHKLYISEYGKEALKQQLEEEI